MNEKRVVIYPEYLTLQPQKAPNTPQSTQENTRLTGQHKISYKKYFNEL